MQQTIRSVRAGVLVAALLSSTAAEARAQIAPGSAPAADTLVEAGQGQGEAGSSAATQELPFTMRIGARVQVRMTHADPEIGDRTSAFNIRRGRLSLGGDAYEHFSYAIQLELAGSDVRLIDANVRSTLSPLATVWVGQGKAFFGRQQLNSSGNLHFVDRTIVDGRFSAGRQQGIALLGRVGTGLEYNLGVYNGEGINQATNPDSRFMTVGRVVFTPFGAYALAESAHDYPESPRLALGVSALNNSAGEDLERVDITRLNTEAAFKVRGLNMTGEFYREWADPREGDRLTTDGWYVQAGYLLPDRTHELAGRCAVIHPRAAGLGDLVEAGVAYSYYFRGHSAKVQMDVRNVRDRATGTDHRELRAQLQLTL